MTTVPGNNIVIQQSGAAQELIHQTNIFRSYPDKAVTQQQANELVQDTIVHDPESSGRLMDITA